MSFSPQTLAKRYIPLAFVSTTLLLGTTGCGLWSSPPQKSPPLSEQLAPLTRENASERQAELKKLAQNGNKTEKRRARYLLATDLIEVGEGAAALEWLKGLDGDYPMLAGEIMVLKAKAYALANETEKAQKTWEKILDRFPKDGVAAEALFALGESQPDLWDQAIQDFPSHPRTIDIATIRTKADISAVEPRLLVAKYGQYVSNYVAYLNRLTKDFQAQLKPEDWETVALGYWKRRMFKQAGLAYVRAPESSLTVYRAGRGLELGDQKSRAIAKYESLNGQYPEAPEVPNALLKLAGLQESPTEALKLLDQALERGQALEQTHKVGQILLAKLELLQKQGQDTTAIRTQLLQDYSNTASAGDFRWKMAQASARAGDWENARDWALRLQTENTDHELAPKATYWAGQWGARSGEVQAPDAAHNHLLRTYPESYYAWRAASLSGWDVADFNTVGSFQPDFQPVVDRFPLPTGSPALQELYQIGAHRAALDRWRWEFQNRAQPSFEEQMTDALLKLQGDNQFEGIFLFLNLYFRAQEEPEQRALYQQWRRDPGVWRALYPLLYLDPIQAKSTQRNLNPLLVLGLMRQESRFRTDIRSSAGALGLMQVLPSTGELTARNLNITDYDLLNPADNINLGTAYLQEMLGRYRDQAVFAIASYNAGPGSVDGWIRSRSTQDLDAFIEAIPFPETNYYVKVVLENYWNYLRLYHPQTRAELEKLTPTDSTSESE